MRKLAAKCPSTLLAVALVFLAVALGQLALPAGVDCRETPCGSEEGGDPDMPDQVTGSALEIRSDAFDHGLSILEGGIFGWNGVEVDVPSNAGRVAVSHHVLQREFLLRFWLSLASIGFAH